MTFREQLSVNLENKSPSIDQTDRISLALDLDFVRSPESYGHDYTRAEVHGQRSIGSEDRLETDGRTEAIALPPVPTQSVKKWQANLIVVMVTNSQRHKVISVM